MRRWTRAERELFADPSYALWAGREELRVGCRAGGFFVVTAATVQDQIRFADCAFASGLPLTGVGSYTFATGVVNWTVTSGRDQLDFRSDRDHGHVSGTWKGAKVDITR